MAERLAVNEKVVGSSPTSGANFQILIEVPFNRIAF